MKLKMNLNFNIAKSKILNANTKLEVLNYNNWIEFIEKYHDYFVWNENTEEGQKILSNLENVPQNFKHRVLARLNKAVCFSKYNEFTQIYDVSVAFYEDLNWISIQFVNTPKIEDLKLFLEMANYLDALLLKDGKEIIDENVIKSLERAE
ncbi:hypothetical protein [Myroides sp. WP-1]|uniref:hypothetical protein n=1 Tax=Myroides sp. WP-1 TaxID=2759944 RepID=UPI0015FCA964|nr:hypothetical protein [Myroides sp. WP-1]MBB1140662.1 hypothetical protein [Myroides sp. WP-1]